MFLGPQRDGPVVVSRCRPSPSTEDRLFLSTTQGFSPPVEGSCLPVWTWNYCFNDVGPRATGTSKGTLHWVLLNPCKRLMLDHLYWLTPAWHDTPSLEKLFRSVTFSWHFHTTVDLGTFLPQIKSMREWPSYKSFKTQRVSSLHTSIK